MAAPRKTSKSVPRPAAAERQRLQLSPLLESAKRFKLAAVSLNLSETDLFELPRLACAELEQVSVLRGRAGGRRRFASSTRPGWCDDPTGTIAQPHWPDCSIGSYAD
jgi:hypothetical protein